MNAGAAARGGVEGVGARSRGDQQGGSAAEGDGRREEADRQSHGGSPSHCHFSSPFNGLGAASSVHST